MQQTRLTLADVIHQFVPPETQDRLIWPHRKVLSHIRHCRTPAMGGELWGCHRCGDRQPLYYSCRDRHCPVCQYQVTQAWYQARKQDVLPVPYHHLVFTLPHELNGWIQVHDRELYRLLFESVWATLKAFGAHRKGLQGELGMMAVLHTWGETLGRHVHLHCLVPGGVVTPTGLWRGTNKPGYLFPVRALSRKYRGYFVSRLRSWINQGELPRVAPDTVAPTLNTLMSKEWAVYSKATLDHTASVLGYLARYTRRIGISNARLLDMDDENVRLTWKDYRDEAQVKVMTLPGIELIRRFLLHVLPKGFMRIRYYGFLANVHRRKKISLIRQQLLERSPDPDQSSATGTRSQPPRWCQRCSDGILVKLKDIPKWPLANVERLSEPIMT